MKTNTILSLRYLLALVLACSFACLSAQTREFNFDFSTNDHGWVAGFSDFDETMRSIMELDSGHLPVPGDASKKGLYITGNNRSDDLFMYYKKKVKVQPLNSRQPDSPLEHALSTVKQAT